MTQQSAASTHLPRLWLWPARLVWVVLVVVTLTLFFAAMPYRQVELLGDPYQLSTSLDQIGQTIENFVFYASSLEVLLAIACLAIALLVFWRKSDDWMGLLVSLGLVFFLTFLPVITALGKYHPAWLTPILILRILGTDVILLVYFLFPDGRFVPRWSKYMVVLMFVAMLPWLFLRGYVPPSAPIDTRSWQDALFQLQAVLMIGLGAYSQVYRYRRVSIGVQRQQTKWVVYGFLMVFIGSGLIIIPYVLFPFLRQPGMASLAYLLLAITFTLLSWLTFPMSLGISILKYRLWDIDLIIRRTLIYGALSLTLGVVFFGGVALLQQVFGAVTGTEESPIVIVVSTLGIAGLFHPLRRRIQRDIDRRFFRKKYDAEQTLAAFAATARDQVELESLAEALLNVTQETMQPGQISLWLNKSDPKRSP